MNHHLSIAPDDEPFAPAHFDPHARLRRIPDDGRHAAVAEYRATCTSMVGVTPHRGDREWSEGA